MGRLLRHVGLGLIFPVLTGLIEPLRAAARLFDEILCKLAEGIKCILASHPALSEEAERLSHGQSVPKDFV